jgi:hypothetical protein
MRRTGQWLRLIGLLIEMLAAVAVVREKGGQATTRIPVPGGAVISIAWAVFALGLGIWMIGQILWAISRPPRRDGT